MRVNMYSWASSAAVDAAVEVLLVPIFGRPNLFVYKQPRHRHRCLTIINTTPSMELLNRQRRATDKGNKTEMNIYLASDVEYVGGGIKELRVVFYFNILLSLPTHQHVPDTVHGLTMSHPGTFFAEIISTISVGYIGPLTFAFLLSRKYVSGVLVFSLVFLPPGHKMREPSNHFKRIQ